MKNEQVKVTVIINNRDLLEWPKAMCKYIEMMEGLHEIIIMDNGSSNRDLLQWYKDEKYKVIFKENLGHTAPWQGEFIDSLETDLYVVTDPDLDLSSVPKDALIYLAEILKKYPTLEKIGFDLNTDNIPFNSPYFDHVAQVKKQIDNLEVIDGLYVNYPIDTTFALYDRRKLNHYKICGARTTFPYIAQHLPWSVISPVGDFKYYLDNASSSSSYLNFTGYKKENYLEKIYESRKVGKVSTKWNSYLSIYDKIFNNLKKSPISLLEIGVQNGGSLEIWSEYFSNAQLLIGCDINPKILDLKYSDPRIRLVSGVASEATTFSTILQYSTNGFDIIIDDGSHISNDTISNFVNYFPSLKPGGLFVIEDMHCAYWPEYGGGYFNDNSISKFFKKLFDLINIEHMRGEVNVKQLFQTFFLNQNLPRCLIDGSIANISIYNSIFVVEKSSNTHSPLLGAEIISGNVAEVDNRVLKLLNKNK